MKKTKKKLNKTLILLTLIFIGIIFFNFYSINYYKKAINILEGVKQEKLQEINTLDQKEIKDALSLDNYLEAKINLSQNNLVFINNCSALVMTIVDAQAISIYQGINKKIDVRPSTHDLIVDLLDNFNISVLMVKIEPLGSDLYSANVFFKQNNKILSLDTRPSDSAGIAVRLNTPVYLNKELLPRTLKIC